MLPLPKPSFLLVAGGGGATTSTDVVDFTTYRSSAPPYAVSPRTTSIESHSWRARRISLVAGFESC